MRHSRLYGIMTGMLYGMLVLSVSSCVKDDFDRYHDVSDALSFEVEVSGGWSEAASTSSTSIRRMSQSTDAEPLYLVTQVSDSAPVSAESGVVTRGTPVESADPMKTGGFGLSAICYTGEWPAEDSPNNWTTNFAHNLNVTKQGDGKWKTSKKLEWPGSGRIRFFAYYPYSENSDYSDYISHSLASDKGAPVLTYTVPDKVQDQPDLLWAVVDCPGKSTGDVKLEFQHALTAVTIKTGTDMLSGTITGVKISGVYGQGSCRIGGTDWTKPSETRDFEITDLNVELLPTKKDDKNGLMINTGSDQGITSPELTFMMVPQTLPAGAKLTINFTDKLTNTARTLTADIGNTSWPAGKKVAYSINSTGIEVKTNFEFSKNPDIDIMPYSGVWYDATYTAEVEVTQVGVETKTIEIPADKVKFQYRFKDSDPWVKCTTEADGLLTIEAQSAYTTMSNGFDKTSENGSEEIPFNLGTEKGETANCYLVDKAGYYSLPLVYGNGYLTLPAKNPDGFKYFPKHDDEEIPADGKISGFEDAVLCWQDAPDLIDPTSVDVVGDNLVFRIRKQTLTQGNALLAVRGTDLATNKKIILWSWHIWVTPYKSKFYSEFYTSITTAKPTGYEMAKYNLGWCDNHDHNNSRTFSLQAVIDMSAYGGTTTETVDIGTFTQMEFKGSDAGDNTYYQWGRKDPMLGGIYNSNTPNYKYHKKGNTSSWDMVEFTMENKQVFNQYNQYGYNYSFCKNLGDKIDIDDYASNGVSIGYAIQHPYMFVTNSRSSDSSGETTDFNYRNHWHKPYKHYAAPYLHDNSHILFNAWDAGATNAGDKTANTKKSVYDPCPPQFKVPPLDAFQGIVDKKSSGKLNGNAWTLTSGGKSITFPITGLRNYALRGNEWTTVEPVTTEPGFSSEEFYKISMPAFKSLTYVSSATIEEKKVNGTTDTYNAYQVTIFRYQDGIGTTPSSNSYGLSVRPIYTAGK